LADALAQRFAHEVPARAYQVGLGDTGRLHWIDRQDGGEVVREEEPGTGVWRRFAVALCCRCCDRVAAVSSQDP